MGSHNEAKNIHQDGLPHTHSGIEAARSIQTYCLMSMNHTETIANLQSIDLNTPFICSSCALVLVLIMFVFRKKKVPNSGLSEPSSEPQTICIVLPLFFRPVWCHLFAILFVCGPSVCYDSQLVHAGREQRLSIRPFFFFIWDTCDQLLKLENDSV